MEIELLSTDALLDELCARFDHLIFAGMKIRSDGQPESPDGQMYEKKRTKGNTRVCKGLSFAMMLYKQEQWDRGAQAVDDDSPSLEG